MTQQLARLSIEEVQPDAGRAAYRFVSIFTPSFFLIIVQPELDEKVGRRTTEDEFLHPTGVERHGNISYSDRSTTIGMHRALWRVVSSTNNENRSPFVVGDKVANLEGATLSFRDRARVRDDVAAAGIERGHPHGSGLDN